MTFNITRGPRAHASDHSSSDEDDSSGIQVGPPSDRGTQTARRPRTSFRRVSSPESPSSVSTHPHDRDEWLICSGGKDKDITVHLDLEVGLDINDYLQCLARLGRLGRFNQAIRLFEEHLAPHVDFFPVVAEYADLLLEQGSFGHLHRFISSRLNDPHVELSEEELLLLKVLKSLADIYTRGALIPALEMTAEALKYLTTKSHNDSAWFRPITGLQIQLMETCVRIIAYAAAHSNFPDTQPFHFPLHWPFSDDGIVWRNNDKKMYGGVRRTHLFSSNEPQRNDHPFGSAFQPKNESAGSNFRGDPVQWGYPRIGDWYRLLVQEGFLWESHRLLRAVLPLFGDSEGHYTVMVSGGFEEFAKLDDISKAGDIFLLPEEISTSDEHTLLTEFANATLLADFLPRESALESVRTAHYQFYRKSHSLALTILSAHPHLINSRPYLNWMLSESSRGLPTESKLQLLADRPRPVSDIWSQSVLSKVQYLQQTDSSILKRGELKETSKDMLSGSTEIILANAKELGDYHLEKSAIQKDCQRSPDFSQRLQAIHSLALLHHDRRQDISGYLECLIDESLLLESSSSTACEGMRKDLQRRLSEFHGSFPFHIDVDANLRYKPAVVFFDNPLLQWMERQVWCRLMKSLGRDAEAEIAPVESLNVERHLPRRVFTQLHPQTLAAAGYKPTTSEPGPSVPGRANPNRAIPAILQEGYRGEDTSAEVVNVEKMLERDREVRKAKRMQERAEQENKAKEQERLTLEQRLAESERERKIAEERASAAEAAARHRAEQEKQLLTLKDPVGRTIVLPFEQCRTFAELEGLMQQVSLPEAILLSEAVKGDYELLDPDGNPIARDHWDSVVQPGWTITMRCKAGPAEESLDLTGKDTLDPSSLEKAEPEKSDENALKTFNIEESDDRSDRNVKVNDGDS